MLNQKKPMKIKQVRTASSDRQHLATLTLPPRREYDKINSPPPAEEWMERSDYYYYGSDVRIDGGGSAGVVPTAVKPRLWEERRLISCLFSLEYSEKAARNQRELATTHVSWRRTDRPDRHGFGAVSTTFFASVFAYAIAPPCNFALRLKRARKNESKIRQWKRPLRIQEAVKLFKVVQNIACGQALQT